MILVNLALPTAQAVSSANCNFQRDRCEMAQCELIGFERPDADLNRRRQPALTKSVFAVIEISLAFNALKSIA